MTSGPPTVTVYWHKVCRSGGGSAFLGFSGGYLQGDITSYVVKLGKFFSKGTCELYSLNITTYSVVVLVETERSEAEIAQQMADCGLGLGHRGDQTTIQQPQPRHVE